MSSPEDLAEFMMHQLLLLQPLDDVQALERTSEGSHTQSTQEIVVADGARRGARRLLVSRIAALCFECVGRSTLPTLPRILGEAGWSRSALNRMMIVQ